MENVTMVQYNHYVKRVEGPDGKRMPGTDEYTENFPNEGKLLCWGVKDGTTHAIVLDKDGNVIPINIWVNPIKLYYTLM